MGQHAMEHYYSAILLQSDMKKMTLNEHQYSLEAFGGKWMPSLKLLCKVSSVSKLWSSIQLNHSLELAYCLSQRACDWLIPRETRKVVWKMLPWIATDKVKREKDNFCSGQYWAGNDHHRPKAPSHAPVPFPLPLSTQLEWSNAKTYEYPPLSPQKCLFSILKWSNSIQ